MEQNLTTAQGELAISKLIHTKSFWMAIVSAVLTVLAMFLPVSSHNLSIIRDAVSIIVAMILGGSGVAMVHAHTAALIAAHDHTHQS